jgi:GABA(A) receptor-associated protein
MSLPTIYEEEEIDATQILEKYPHKVPIILERSESCDFDKTLISKINKFYCLQKELTLYQFMHTLRKTMSLPPEKALFIFIGNANIPLSVKFGEIYETYKSSDNFLHIVYTGESTFGFFYWKQ